LPGSRRGVASGLGHQPANNPRIGHLVRLLCFGELNVDEVAAVLDTSTRTVEREWTCAKADLLEWLAGDDVR